MSNWNIQDNAESLTKRASWEKITSGKHAELVTNMNTANTELQTALKTTLAKPNAEAKALASVLGPVRRAQKELSKVADLNKYDWVKKADTNITEEAFTSAVHEYHKVGGNYEAFITGKEKVNEVGVGKALQESFENAQKATGKVKSLANNMFGMAKVEGWRSALEHNVGTFKFWDKEAPKASKAAVGFRAVTSVGGCALMADAFRSKTKQGDDRSASGRLFEFVTGAGVLGASLTAGHAR